MIHKFNRWRNNKKYNEAYLDFEGGRIIEEEKKGRIEIGPNEYIEEDTMITIVRPVDPNKKKSKETENESQGPGELDEDNRVVEKPKSKLAYFWPIFWLLFLVTALYYFLPFSKELLNKDISDYIPSVADVAVDNTLNEEEKEVVEITTEDNEMSNDTESGETILKQDSETESNIELNLGSMIEGARENSPIDIQMTNDTTKIYADIHALIVQQTQELRNVVQQYVSRNAQHVQMASLGGRIEIRLNQASYRLNQIEDDVLKNILLQRIDRLSEMSKMTSKFDRSNAMDATNSFIEAENNDSKQFVDQFLNHLDNEGRSYKLEDGYITFN